MSENKRSFFSTIPGLVTGLAGLLTGIVGLVTVLIQRNVIGGDDSNGSTAVNAGPATSAPAGGGGAGGTTPATPPATFSVDPKSVRLALNEREKAVKVTNDGPGAITMLAPEFSGADKAVFKTDAGCTNTRLEPGRSCTLKVLFTPSNTLKAHTATLVLNGDRTLRATEVPVDASTLLGG